MFKGIVNSPMEFRSFYDGAMRSSDASKFSIPTNNIRSKTLIFVGGDDRMWDSATMGNQIQSSIADAQIHIYEDAGHVFFGPTVYNNVLVGGTYQENVRALMDSNEKLLEFIK